MNYIMLLGAPVTRATPPSGSSSNFGFPCTSSPAQLLKTRNNGISKQQLQRKSQKSKAHAMNYKTPT